MLFMNVFTYKPEHSKEVIERWMKEEIPEGVKIVGEWPLIAGNKVFRLIETDSPEAYWGLTMNWSNIGKIKSYPVMKSEDLKKLVQEMMG